MFYFHTRDTAHTLMSYLFMKSWCIKTFIFYTRHVQIENNTLCVWSNISTCMCISGDITVSHHTHVAATSADMQPQQKQLQRHIKDGCALSDEDTTADGNQTSAFTDRLSALILITNLKMFVRNIVNLGDNSPLLLLLKKKWLSCHFFVLLNLLKKQHFVPLIWD